MLGYNFSERGTLDAETVLHMNIVNVPRSSRCKLAGSSGVQVQLTSAKSASFFKTNGHEQATELACMGPHTMSQRALMFFMHKSALSE